MRASADLTRCKEWNKISRCNLPLHHAEPHDFQSNRKPYNQDAGYVASLRSGQNRGWVVIYEATAQGIDTFGARYAVVCQTHNTIVGVTSMPKARSAMKAVDFCEECQEVKL